MKIRPTRHKHSTTTHLKFALLSFSFCRAVNPQLSSPHTATRCLSPELQNCEKNCARWIETLAANIFYSSPLPPSLLVCTSPFVRSILPSSFSSVRLSSFHPSFSSRLSASLPSLLRSSVCCLQVQWNVCVFARARLSAEKFKSCDKSSSGRGKINAAFGSDAWQSVLFIVSSPLLSADGEVYC